MGFEAMHSLNQGAEKVCSSRLVYGLIRNPIYTALLITALCLVVLFYIVRQSTYSTPTPSNDATSSGHPFESRLVVRCGVYISLGVSLLLFLHYYALRRHMASEAAQQGVRDIATAIYQSAAAGVGSYPVQGAKIGASEWASVARAPVAQAPAAVPVAQASAAVPYSVGGGAPVGAPASAPSLVLERVSFPPPITPAGPPPPAGTAGGPAVTAAPAGTARPAWGIQGPL